MDNQSLEESGVAIVVNPYNFNNNLISEQNISDILSKYEIENEIVNLGIYQKAFIHKSYSKKDPRELGENIVIADTIEDFTRAIIKYLSNDKEQKRIATNGRELVESSYDNIKIVNNLLTFFKQIMN